MLKINISLQIVASQNSLGYAQLSEQIKNQISYLMSLKGDKFTNYTFIKSLEDDCYYGTVSGSIDLKGKTEMLTIDFNGISESDFLLISTNLK